MEPRNASPTVPDFNATAPGSGAVIQMPTETDSNSAPALLGVLSSLLFISLVLVTARIWSRLRISLHLHWDDWAVLAATAVGVMNYILTAVAVAYGFGHPSRFVPFASRRTALEFIFISLTMWYWAMTFVKLSVAFLLLRLKYESRHWRIFVYTVMTLLVITLVIQTVFQFTQCRPFSIYWDPTAFFTHRVKCFKQKVVNVNIITYSCIQVAIDLMFSLTPITFIRKLRRPRREKIFLSVLMALGLFASFAAIMRTLTLQAFYTTTDFFESNIMTVMWAMLEQQFALIAATIPTLKAFFEMALVKAGQFFYNEGAENRARGRLVQLGLLPEFSATEGSVGNGKHFEKALE